MSSSSRKSRRRLVAQVAGAAAAVCASAAASAAGEWIFDPRVELGAVYDDNYRLEDLPGQQIEVEGAALDAALGLIREGQVSKLELTPRVHASRFPNESSENSTDYFLDAQAQRHTQRLQTKFDGRFAEESVISSELLTSDFPGTELGEPTQGDTGRVSVRNRRRLVYATPSLSWDWTQRRHLTFDLQYIDINFQDNGVFEQVGYSDYGAAGGIVWDVSKRNTFSVQAHGDLYSPDDASPDTTTGGVVAEWRTAANEIRSYYVRVGADHSTRDATGSTGKLSATSFNGGVGVAWQFQLTHLLVDLLQSAEPSASGAIVNRSEARFRIRRNFTPRFEGFFGLRGIRTEGLDNSVVTVSNRKYATSGVGFDWRTTLRFTVHGEYNYTWQKFEGDLDSAKSNGVNVSLIYQPRRGK